MNSLEIIDRFDNEDNTIYVAESFTPSDKNAVLFLHTLKGGGSQMAIDRLIPYIRRMGMNIFMVAIEDGTYRERFIEEYGVAVVIHPNLIEEEAYTRFMQEAFDFVLVNSCAGGFLYYYQGVDTKVYWWIHEDISVFSMNAQDSFFHPNRLSDNVVFLTPWRRFADAFRREYQKEVKLLTIGYDDVEVPDRIRDDKLRFLIPGTYNVEKGFQDALIAATKLPDYILEKCAFTFVGYIGQEELYRTFVEMSNKLPYIEVIGAVSSSELEKLYATSDVIVFPTLLDIGPLTTVESFRLGRCTIISDAAGISDYVVDGESAYIYPCEDTDKLATIFKRVFINRQELELMAAGGRAVFEKNFTRAVMEDDIRNIWGNI